MFLSIFAATCRPENILLFFDNLAQTCTDPTSFEVIVKIDDGAFELQEIIEKYKKHSSFTIKYLMSAKLDGYYSLDVGYNLSLRLMHPDSYFCWLLTDEIRLQTKGWDDILKKYIGLFDDDIFRLKLSIFQLKNYLDMFDCLPSPDNYAVTTRKWLEITGGWGNFWGPDSWHQCIDFFLGCARNQFYPHGIWRSIPILDIKVGGQEAGQGIASEKEMMQRAIKINQGWNHHSTHAAQENFNKLAQRLNAHIYASKLHLEIYFLEEDSYEKTVTLYSRNEELVEKWKYRLPTFRIKMFVGYKKLSIRRWIYSSYISMGWAHKIVGVYRSLISLKTKMIKIKIDYKNRKYKKLYSYDGKHLNLLDNTMAELKKENPSWSASHEQR